MNREKRLKPEHKRLLQKIKFDFGEEGAASSGNGSDDDEQEHQEKAPLNPRPMPSGKVDSPAAQARWLEGLEELKKFAKAHGTMNVEFSDKENAHLYRWMTRQRTNYRGNRMSAERIKLLQDSNFEWDPPQRTPLSDAHDDTSSSDDSVSSSPSSSSSSSSSNSSSSSLSTSSSENGTEEKGEKLNRFMQMWKNRLNQLKQYKKKHGHMNINSTRQAKDSTLYDWTYRQRKLWEANKLSAEKIKLLDDIGFEWELPDDYFVSGKRKADWSDDSEYDSDKINHVRRGEPKVDTNKLKEDQWLEKFEALKDYQQRFGHLDVPNDRSGDFTALHYWVSRQKSAFRRNKMTNARRELLEGIGFVLDPSATPEVSRSIVTPTNAPLSSTSAFPVQSATPEASKPKFNPAHRFENMWMERYEQLKEYKEEYGTTVIGYGVEEYRSLYHWTWRQRKVRQMIRTHCKLLLSTLSFDHILIVHHFSVS